MRLRTTLAILGISVLGTLPAPAWTITETPLAANSHPNFIIVGPDGNIWFTEYGTSNIGVIDARTGELLHEYHTKTNSCGPVGLTLGSDGNVWYACILVPAIGRVTHAGVASEYGTDTTLAGPIVAAGGYLYYMRTDGNAEVADDVTGAFVDTTTGGSNTGFGLSAGGDGWVWFASPSAHKIFLERYTGTSLLGSDLSTGTDSPYVVAWCQAFGGVYFVSPATDEVGMGTIDAGPSHKSAGAGSYPNGIACAPDGEGWFAASSGNFIGRYSDLAQFPIPTASSYPYQLVVGPDGSIWFTENGAGKIGRLRLHPPGDVNGSGTVDVADVFYLINFLFAGGPAPN